MTDDPIQVCLDEMARESCEAMVSACGVVPREVFVSPVFDASLRVMIDGQCASTILLNGMRVIVDRGIDGVACYCRMDKAA